MRCLDTDTAGFATRHVMDDLRARYRDLPAVLSYLEALQADITAHLDDFRKGKEAIRRRRPPGWPSRGRPGPAAGAVPGERAGG